MMRRWTGLMLAAVTALLCCGATLADTLHLKDGRVLEGRVEREGDGFIYFLVKIGTIEHSQLFTSEQILKIERDEDPATDAATRPRPREQRQPREAASPGATRVAFISIEGEVGLMLNAGALKRSVEIASADEPEVIVLVVNSPGGALNEVMKLSDLIHKEMKKDYRVVAWIESAISAAAMTSFNCEEIYMTRQGAIGAATAFIQQGGQATAVKDAELEQILEIGAELSRRGKRNPLIMRAMQVFMDLSCDIDENGIVTWRNDLQGRYTVNTKDRILTLNSVDALRYGVSRGTADTKEQLMQTMGIPEWTEVGRKGDENQRDFRRNVATLQARANELLARYNLALQAAGGGDQQSRNRYIGRARTILNELRGLVRRAPSFEEYTIFQPEWFREREEELRRLSAGNR